MPAIISPIILLLIGAAAAAGPAYEPHPDTDDARATPKTAAAGTPFVRPLGAAAGADACAAACAGWRNASTPVERCFSFTVYNSSAAAGLAGRCFGHVTLNWFPHPPSGGGGAFSGRLKLPCRSPLDCSLNGVCSSKGGDGAAGGCVCAAGWKGLRCGELDLQPVDPAAVGLRDADYPSWGAAIWGESKTEWHMYTSETTRKCGLSAWFTNSEVAHAVSSSPLGPYKRKNDLFPPFSTNPSLAPGAPGGQLVMSVAMATADGSARLPSDECLNCTDGSTPPSCRPRRPGFFTNVAVASSPNGPWEVSNLVGHRSWGFNFAMVINADGSAVGVTRLGFVNSTQWDNPKAWQNPLKQSMPFSSEPLAGGEDPFIYKDHAGNFHCLFHSFDKSSSANGTMYPGSHAFSTDGVDWHFSGSAYSNQVAYTDGRVQTMKRRERPHLVFDPADKTRVLALANGVIPTDGAGKYGDRSFTLVQQVAQ